MLDTHVVSEALLGVALDNGDQYAFILRLMVLINKDTSKKTIAYMRQPDTQNDQGLFFCTLVRACEWCGCGFGASTPSTADFFDLSTGLSTYNMLLLCSDCFNDNVVRLERLAVGYRQMGVARLDHRIFDEKFGLPGTSELLGRLGGRDVCFLMGRDKPAVTARVRTHDMKGFVESFQPHLDAFDMQNRVRLLEMMSTSMETSDESDSDDDFLHLVTM